MPEPQQQLPRRVPRTHAPTEPALTRKKTLVDSYKSLSPRARIAFGLFLGASGFVGLVVSDQLEKKYPAPTETGK
ncbi:hypothetical protein EXIGLDRAFT_726690 [Exidia glandulosa HHB12029]|uniref:Uncharacterized protein n=1 Tax=Exidia glandulosa HHB12029 TaxID=1314781 RepID=A0A165YZ38_EXIGL|nr:hypothetical protein EXIGLDRAFT_718852 [Exidia glandulosa HHB12029]KZV78000.1 hypothetical protein EXIGLDRAFT_718812 [Exidia glandulosa HHB12029]KZV84823.1 hypothetical protein EXIGLDRAFT_726690 [Exidia glandulosa HHB12029]